MTSFLERNVFDDMEKAIDDMFKAKAKYTMEDGFLKMTPFQCRSRAVRDSLRILEEKGLLPADERAWRSIVELANAIEPFLRTGEMDPEEDILGTGMSAAEYVTSHSPLVRGGTNRPRSSSQPPRGSSALSTAAANNRSKLSSPGSSIGGHSGRNFSDTRLGRSRSQSNAAAAFSSNNNNNDPRGNDASQKGAVTIRITEADQRRIRTTFQKTVSHIARLEESVIHPPKQPSLPPTAPPDVEFLQIENEKHLKHIDSLERQLGHLRTEREKIVAANRAVVSQQSKENNAIRKKLAEALKDLEEAKKIFVEKEAALETALAHLTITQDDLKRVKHEAKVKQHHNKANLHILHKAQTSLVTGGSSSPDRTNRSSFGPNSPNKKPMSAEEYLRGSNGSRILTVDTGSGNDGDGEGGHVSYLADAFLPDEEGAANAGGGYAVDVDETAIGVGLSTLGVDLDTIGNVDAAEALSSSFITEKRRKAQEKYGLQTTLNLKATNDVYRQELHKERSERAREKATISAALDDALKRAKYSESVVDEMRMQLMHEKERREAAEANIDEMSQKVLAMETAVSKADARRKDAELESDRQQTRAASIETQLHEVMEETSFMEKQLRDRIDDLSKQLHDQRMSQVEMQAELTRQSAVALENAQKIGIEQDLLYQKIENLTFENVDLAEDLQKKEELLRSSGHLITDLSKQVSQANLVVSNPPSPLRSLRSLTPSRSSLSPSKPSFFARSSSDGDVGLPIDGSEVEEALQAPDQQYDDNDDGIHDGDHDRDCDQQQQYEDNDDGAGTANEEGDGSFQEGFIEDESIYEATHDQTDTAGGSVQRSHASQQSRTGSRSQGSSRSPHTRSDTRSQPSQQMAGDLTARSRRSSSRSPSHASQQLREHISASGDAEYVREDQSVGAESELTGPSQSWRSQPRSPRTLQSLPSVPDAQYDDDFEGDDAYEECDDAYKEGDVETQEGHSTHRSALSGDRTGTGSGSASRSPRSAHGAGTRSVRSGATSVSTAKSVRSGTGSAAAGSASVRQREQAGGEGYQGDGGSIAEFEFEELRAKVEQAEVTLNAELQSLASRLRSEFEEEKQAMQATFYAQLHADTEETSAQLSAMERRLLLLSEENSTLRSQCKEQLDQLTVQEEQLQQSERDQELNELEIKSLRSALEDVAGSDYPSLTEKALAKISPRSGSKSKSQGKDSAHSSPSSLSTHSNHHDSQSRSKAHAHAHAVSDLRSPHPESTASGGGSKGFFKKDLRVETEPEELDIPESLGVTPMATPRSKSLAHDGDIASSASKEVSTAEAAAKRLDRGVKKLRSVSSSIVRAAERSVKSGHSVSESVGSHQSTASMTISRNSMLKVADTLQAQTQSIEENTAQMLEQVHELREQLIKSRKNQEDASVYSAALSERERELSQDLTRARLQAMETQSQVQELSKELQKEREEKAALLKSQGITASSTAGSTNIASESGLPLIAYPAAPVASTADRRSSVYSAPSVGGSVIDPNEYQRQIDALQQKLRTMQAQAHEGHLSTDASPRKDVAGGADADELKQYYEQMVQELKEKYEGEIASLNEQMAEYIALLKESLAEAEESRERTHGPHGDDDILSISVASFDSPAGSTRKSSAHRLEALFSAQKTPLRSSSIASLRSSLEADVRHQKQVDELQRLLTEKDKEVHDLKEQVASLSTLMSVHRESVAGDRDDEGSDRDTEDRESPRSKSSGRSKRSGLRVPDTPKSRALADGRSALSADSNDDIFLTKLSEQEVKHKAEIEKLIQESRDQLLSAQSTFENMRVEMKAKHKAQIDDIKTKYKEEIKNLKKQLKTSQKGEDNDSQTVGSMSVFTVGTDAASQMSRPLGLGLGLGGAGILPSGLGGYPYPGTMNNYPSGGSVASHPDTLASIQQQFELQSQVMQLQHELKGEKGDRQRDLRELEQKYQRDIKDLEQQHQRDVRDLEQQRVREVSDAKQEYQRTSRESEQRYQGKIDKLKKKLSEYKSKVKLLEGDEYHSDDDDDNDDRSVSSRRSRSADPRRRSSATDRHRRRSSSGGRGRDDESDAASTALSTAMSTAMSTVVQDLDEAKNKIKQLKEEHEDHVRELKASIKERDAMIQELQQAVIARDKSMLEHQLQKQNTLQGQHDKMVAKKDAEIERLEEKLKQSKEELAVAQLDLLALRKELEKQKQAPDAESKEALVSQLQHLNIIKDRQEREIGSLMEQVQRLEHQEEELKKTNDLLQQVRDHYEGELEKQRKYYESQIGSIQEALADPKSPKRTNASISLGNITSASGITSASPNHQLIAENDELQKRVKKAEARSIALTQQLQSMPASLQVAVAERRVVEARLQKALVASDARLKAQIVVAETAKKELQAFLDIAAQEKAKLTEKIRQQAATIHQLTHHLHTIQSGGGGSSGGMSLADISAAAAVSDIDLDIPPPPWADKTMPTVPFDPNSASAAGRGRSDILSDRELADAAFAKTVSESFQPFKSAPFILPQRSGSTPASPARNKSLSRSMPDASSMLRSPARAGAVIPQSPLRASADDIRNIRVDDPYEPLRNSFYGVDVRASVPGTAKEMQQRYTDLRPAPITTSIAKDDSTTGDASRPNDEVKSESSYSQSIRQGTSAQASVRSQHAGADGGNVDLDAMSHRSQRSHANDPSRRSYQSTPHQSSSTAVLPGTGSVQGSAAVLTPSAGVGSGGSINSRQPLPAHLTPRPQSTTASTAQIYGNIATTDRFSQPAAAVNGKLDSSVASSAETIPMNFVSSPSSATSAGPAVSAAGGNEVRDTGSGSVHSQSHRSHQQSEAPLPPIRKYSSQSHGFEEVSPEQAAFPAPKVLTEGSRRPSYASTLSSHSSVMHPAGGSTGHDRRAAGDDQWGGLGPPPPGFTELVKLVAEEATQRYMDMEEAGEELQSHASYLWSTDGSNTETPSTAYSHHSHRSHHSQQQHSVRSFDHTSETPASAARSVVRNIAAESPASFETSHDAPWMRTIRDPMASSASYHDEGPHPELESPTGFVNDEIEAAMVASMASGAAVSSLLDLQSDQHSHTYHTTAAYPQEETVGDNDSSVFRGIRSGGESIASSARIAAAGGGRDPYDNAAYPGYGDPYDFRQHGDDSYGDHQYH